ncbi:hypothetical protein N7454_009407 [Penicillium verhagenii]|nr:hypothetical protein N7454_009407 [Penicillium verhagenii]
MIISDLPKTNSRSIKALPMDASTLWFLHHRTNIVSALDDYRANIWSHERRYYREIATCLETAAHNLALILTCDGIGSKMARCVRERVSRISTCLNSLREVLILHRDQEPGEVSEVLFMLGRHVGRMRLVGMADPYAEAMDKQLEELPGYQSRWVRRNWRALKFSDPRCVCSLCK